jgi:hypothetical protein
MLSAPSQLRELASRGLTLAAQIMLQSQQIKNYFPTTRFLSIIDSL